MNHFDFNRHFQNYNQHKFYNEKTYADLLSDVTSFSSQFLTPLSSVDTVALKIQSPYLAFVAILACLKEKKLPILLSHLETASILLALREQIDFEMIIEDQQILKTLVSKNSETSFPLIDIKKPALVVFSSGTTSTPKGVALSLSNLFYSAKGFAEYFSQTENESSLMNLPHHHVGGLMILWRAFFSGGSITTDLNSPIDFLSLVPLQLKRMMEDKTKLQLLKNIRVILVGGAPLSSALKEEAKGLGLNLYETYGMSETASLVMINGSPLAYREVELDELGFFKIKGKTLAVGYFQKNHFIPIPADWFKTSDIGSRDELGIFHFKQRNDLIFISGGENINPLLIEEVIRKNSFIKEAYLIALPDEKWGESGILLYETKTGDDLSNNEFQTFLKQELHPYHIPKFSFKTRLNLEGQLKAKRSELKKLAQELYLKNIFSFDFFEVPDAPVIIFFHGFMGDKDDLKNISNSLGTQYSRLYIDLPGHGNTKIENFYSNSDLFKKLSDFINLFSSNPIFYGYSMGGRIALYLALHFLTPQFLILESAGLGLLNSDEQLLRQKNDLLQFFGVDQKDLPEFLNRWYQNPMFKIFREHPDYQSEIKKRSLHDLNEWRESQKFLSSGCFPLMSETLEKISLTSFPLLYIYGESDSKYQDFAQSLGLLEAARKVRISAIAGAGHNPHKTHVLEMTNILIKSLK
jgi:O-succinylbenzoic acid--CoA ligase